MTVVNNAVNMPIHEDSQSVIHSQTQHWTSSTPDIKNPVSFEMPDTVTSHHKQCTHNIGLDFTNKSSCCFSLDFNSNEIQEYSEKISQTQLSSDASSLPCLSLKSESDECSQSTDSLDNQFSLTHSLSGENETYIADTVDESATETLTQYPKVPLDLNTISIISTPSLTPSITKENYEKKLIALSRFAWGTPWPNALESQKKEEMALHALRDSNINILSQYESPFSTSRQKSRKRTISAALSTPSTVPHLDKRMLSSTYKISLENDKIIAKNLGGWNTFFSLKGKLASIPRDQLEYLLLETCCTEPRLISRITNSSIDATNKMIFHSNHLPL